MIPCFSFICRDVKQSQASGCMNVLLSGQAAPGDILWFINIVTKSQHRNVKIRQRSSQPFFLIWRAAAGCLTDAGSSILAVICRASVGGLHDKARFVQGCLLPPFQAPRTCSGKQFKEVASLPHNYRSLFYSMCHGMSRVFPSNGRRKIISI